MTERRPNGPRGSRPRGVGDLGFRPNTGYVVIAARTAVLPCIHFNDLDDRHADIAVADFTTETRVRAWDHALAGLLAVLASRENFAVEVSIT